MITTLLYTLISVLIVSLISLIGILSISINIKSIKRVLLYFVSFAAGALFGDSILHLIPESFKENNAAAASLFILLGIAVSFFIEKVIHWRHCHHYDHGTHCRHEHKPFAYVNLIGDSVHNFIDGLIIAGSYLVRIPVGISTTLAVILHEIPQEIGDFAILLHGGFSRMKALLFNLLTALTAVIGALAALALSKYTFNLTNFLIPFAAGTFIYIAGSDLIPELHKEVNLKKSGLQFLMFLIGILIMFLLLYVG